MCDLFKRLSTMEVGSSWKLRCILLLMLQLIQRAWSCPELCTCKWKNGKQTVECIDKGLTLIPNGLDHGTQVLEFSGNNLQVLPKERFRTIGLINLQKIFMARCKISKVDDAAFRGLSNLVELDLSQNLLVVVPSPIFADFPSLMRLTLSDNPIKVLKSHGFQHLIYLTTLELSNCDINLIEDEAFIGLTHLEWLKLDGNKLTTMRGSHILPDSLHGVDLHNNRWQCDCNSQDLYTWLLNFNIPHTVEPKCSTPQRLSGQNIRSLGESDLACLPDVSPTTFYLEISEGKNISLLCQVSAIPEAKVSWWFQGQVLQNDSMVAPGIHLYYYIEEGTVEKRSELFIYNTNSEDNGTFACIAENPAGKSQSNYTIRVIVKEEPIVIVVTFPFEYILAIAIGAGAFIIIVLIVIILCILKCKRSKKQRKKKESSKDVAMQYPTSIIKSSTSSTCADSIPPKLNGSILVTDQPHHVALYASSTREFTINNMENSVCFNPTTLRSYQIEQNPDLINDTESVGNGRKNLNDDDDKQNDQADEEGADNFDTNTVLSVSSMPPRQVKWQDQQNYPSNVSTLPRGMRSDMYQLVADVHLNPGCFLDADGYPIDFGLPKIQPMQTIQQPLMVTDGSSNFYRTLPHNRTKHKVIPNLRYSREAEFFARSTQSPSFEHFNPADVRYTVEGYPYTQRQIYPNDQQVGLPDPNFIPSPPEGYKSETHSPAPVQCCTSPQGINPGVWPQCVPASYHPQAPPRTNFENSNGNYVLTRCVPTQTTDADSRLATDKIADTTKGKPPVRQSSGTKDLENPSESPDEGYVGDGVEAPEI